MPELILIRGLPGSGKTTMAKKISSERGHSHYEADQWMTWNGVYTFMPKMLRFCHEKCQDFTENDICLGLDVIVSNTFTTLREMEHYLMVAKSRGYAVTVIKMTGKYGSVHDVPEFTVEKMKARWEDYPGEFVIEGVR